MQFESIGLGRIGIRTPNLFAASKMAVGELWVPFAATTISPVDRNLVIRVTAGAQAMQMQIGEKTAEGNQVALESLDSFRWEMGRSCYKSYDYLRFGHEYPDLRDADDALGPIGIGA